MSSHRSSRNCGSCTPRPCTPCKTTRVVKCDPCVNKCDPCDKPYVITCTSGCHGCVATDICVVPDPCLLKEEPFKTYFCALREAIIYYRIDLMLDAVVDATTYNALLAVANQVATKVTGGRVLISLPDGTVVIDTFVGATNTYANFVAKLVGENHNSRIAIHQSLNHQNGTGWENKYSTTTTTKQNYVAVRLGRYLKHIGAIRLSADVIVV